MKARWMKQSRKIFGVIILATLAIFSALGCKSELRTCPVCHGKGYVGTAEYVKRTGGNEFDREALDRLVEPGQLACPRCGGEKQIRVEFLSDEEERQTRPFPEHETFKPDDRPIGTSHGL